MSETEHETPALKEAKQLLHRWLAAAAERNPEKAAALYADSGLAFWGTFGSYCRTNRAQAREYFDHFLDAESLACEIREIHWREAGPEAVLATGWYSFMIRRQGESGPSEAKARFTFGFRRLTGGEWNIVEHHSSLFPEGGY
jgi:uncharacterized protein (TIGR02246 family)